MSELDVSIRLEQPGDFAAVSDLAARAFGPGRFARSAYRVREGVAPVASLALTAWRDGGLIGSIRFTPVRIGGADGALLLGPLVVEPAHVGQGCGRRLVRDGVERAKAEGHRLILLVGDMSYYGRLGFSPVPAGQIELPGPVDPGRLLAAELEAGALAAYKGMVRGAATVPRGTR